MIQIRNRYTGAVIYESSTATKTLGAVVEAVAMGISLREANLRMMDLRHAYLKHADLSYADLSHSNLRRADLAHADLSHAQFAHTNLDDVDFTSACLIGASLVDTNLYKTNFRRANLTGASLLRAFARYTDFSRAKLTGIVVAWESHDLITEILRRAVGHDVDRRAFADGVIGRRKWCWNEHLEANEPCLPWALAELAKWIRPDDDHPQCLDQYRIDAEGDRL